ncbi:MAG: hypothetical protein K1W37_07820 [Lachnospiraceae bacterium]
MQAAYDPEHPYDNLEKCIRLCGNLKEQLIGMVDLIAEMGEFTREAADDEIKKIIDMFSGIDICHAYVTEGEVVVFMEKGEI